MKETGRFAGEACKVNIHSLIAAVQRKTTNIEYYLNSD